MSLRFEGYSYGRALGRKRVVVSNNGNSSSSSSSSSSSLVESCATRAPLKRLCSGKFTVNSEMSRLEALPQDLLVRVLCAVEHDDLEQLFRVSTTIKEATEIAKLMHFDVHTPKKQVVGLHDAIEIGDANEFEEIEAPNAPLRKCKSRLNGRNLAGICTALFTDNE